MKTIKYELILEGLQSPEGTISTRAAVTRIFLLICQSLKRWKSLKFAYLNLRHLSYPGLRNRLDTVKKRFQLVMKDGQVIPGRINEEFVSIEELRQLWGKKVSVKGTINFRPSGKIRLLEAHMIKLMEKGEEIFETIPVMQTEFEFVRAFTAEAERRDWLKDIWGKWPGDETIQ